MSERVKWADLTPRERDALVAEKVMGLVPCTEWQLLHHGGLSGPAYGLMAGSCTLHGGHPDQPSRCMPEALYPRPYTTDIATAWEVVEKLDCNFDLHHYPRDTDQETFEVDGPPKTWCAVSVIRYAEAWGDTAPEAICIAALRAVGVEVGAA